LFGTLGAKCKLALDYGLGLGYAHFVEAIAAIDRPLVAWDEGDGGFFATASADDGVLDANAAAGSNDFIPQATLVGAALWAARRLVGQPLLGVESLFASCPDECGTALAALQIDILMTHLEPP